MASIASQFIKKTRELKEKISAKVNFLTDQIPVKPKWRKEHSKIRLVPDDDPPKTFNEVINDLEDLKLRSWFPEKKVSFSAVFEGLCKQFGNERSLHRSEMFSTFFCEVAHDLSISLSTRLSAYLESISDVATRRDKTKAILDDLLQVNDRDSLISFLENCISSGKLSIDSSDDDQLIVYITSKNEECELIFPVHLGEASSFDINNIVNALKKQLLKVLLNVISAAKVSVLGTELAATDKFVKKLNDYHWIKTLSSIQFKLEELLQSELAPTSEQLQDIGINMLPEDLSLMSIQSMLNLLKHYGKIAKSIKTARNNVKVTFTGVNMSLKDISSNFLAEPFSEVHFLCTHCFYIDESLHGEKWSSKNITVYSPSVVIDGHHVFDVSGEDGIDGSVLAGDLQKAEDGEPITAPGPGNPGTKGKDATPGKSGGNILICSDRIKDSNLLSLIANGGNGGNGQDGGDGQDGKELASTSVNISDWPHCFAHWYTKKPEEARKEIERKMMELRVSNGYKSKLETCNRRYPNPRSFYSRTETGVQLLFGFYCSITEEYGFLYSKSKDGESADGGDAGMGGRGGGGGKRGCIEFAKLDGCDIPMDIDIIANNGDDGKPGATGKPGKAAITHRVSDFLLVDEWGARGTTQKHPEVHDPNNPLFIDVEGFSKGTNRDKVLGNSKYYCNEEISRNFPGIHFPHNCEKNMLRFFKASHQSNNCMTRYGKHAIHGEVVDEEQVIATTATKKLDQRSLTTMYLMLENQKLTTITPSALLQSLKDLEETLQDKIEQQETVLEKEHHKAVCHMKYQDKTATPSHTEFRPKPALVMSAQKSIIFNTEEINSFFEENPKEAKDFQLILSTQSSESVSHKYEMIIEIVRKKSAKLGGIQIYVLDRKIKRICNILNLFLIPILHVIHFKDASMIERLLQLLDDIYTECKRDSVQDIGEAIHALVFPQYKLLVLAEIHSKLIRLAKYEQLMASQVYYKISQQTTVKNLKQLRLQTIESICYTGELSLPPTANQSFAKLPLDKTTVHALKALITFISDKLETYESMNHSIIFPNFTLAIESEYEAYHHTISDFDLLFIIDYLQENFLRIVDEPFLEDILCEPLQLVMNDTPLRSYSTLYCDGEKYSVVSFEKQETSTDSIVIKLVLKSQTSESRHYLSMDAETAQFDSSPVQFPESLLVSTVDAHHLWQEVKFLCEEDAKSDKDMQTALGNIPLWSDVSVSQKDAITSALKLAKSWSNLPFGVFMFQRPTQWVEQLFRMIIRKNYHTLRDDLYQEFIDSLDQAVSGLALCTDKTVYFTFFKEFLLKGGSNHPHNELLQTLQCIKEVFIDRKLCTLVTVEGIDRARAKSSTKMTFEYFCLHGVIDKLGSIDLSLSIDEIQPYCGHDESLTEYLTSMYLMQHYCQSLKGKDLLFWTHKMRELGLRMDLQDIVNDRLDDSTYEKLLLDIHMLIQQHGHEKVVTFISSLKARKPLKVKVLSELLWNCSHNKWLFNTVKSLIMNSDQQFGEITAQLSRHDWEIEYGKVWDVSQIISAMKCQFSPDVASKLDEIATKLAEIKSVEKCASQFSDRKEYPANNICDYTCEEISQWTCRFQTQYHSKIDKDNLFNNSLFTEAFAVIRRAVTVFFSSKGKSGIIPRDCQMVATLMFFQNLSPFKTSSETKLMLEIATGEGKTMILSMIAVMKALLGETVDIVTSSSVLATRDAAAQKPLYNLFKITVDHCCYDEEAKRENAYSACIVYGDIGSFQRDILQTDFFAKKIRTSRNYENVFIDEVDSMLVDKGETMLYLPHPIPQLSTLEGVYLRVWAEVNKEHFIGVPEEQDLLHDYLQHDIFGGLRKTAFTRCPLISIELSAKIHNWCVKSNILDKDYHTLKKSCGEIIDKVSKIPFLPTEQKEVLQQEIVLVIQEHIGCSSLSQSVPTELHPFIRKSLKSWIKSAVTAKFLRPNKEYIIDIDRRQSAADRYPKIIIMDNETGVEQESSEWGNGLHQFLQLKHHLRVSTESLKAVYMSNITFFTLYTNIIGVTGTIGSSEEHALFNKLYKNTKLATIPRNVPSRLKIESSKCETDERRWLEAIVSDVKEKIKNRVVLLICEDVAQAKYMFKNIKVAGSVRLYTSSHEEKLEEMGKVEPGLLIIATNLAGRGTDIKLSKAVEQNGGLHVCLAYLPPNVRVERQAYGRAARGSDPGSCRMIFLSKEKDLSYAIRKRDLIEAHRVAEIENDYEFNIKLQEELFSLFKKEYGDIKDSQEQSSYECKVKADFIMDCWAFVLDKYTEDIEALPNKPCDRQKVRERIRRDFETEFKTQIDSKMSISRFLQLGHAYMKQDILKDSKFEDAKNTNDINESKKAYRQAAAITLVSEPIPSDLEKLAETLSSITDPFLFYYYAAVIVNDIKWTTPGTKRGFKRVFYHLLPIMQGLIEECEKRITTLQVANRYQDQSLTDGTLYYEQQKQNEIEVYSKFIETIQDVLGRDLTPKTLQHTDWNDDEAMRLFNSLKEELKRQKVSSDYRISRCQARPRLQSLLSRTSSYNTFQKRIAQRVDSISQKPTIKRDDFKGVLPDKVQFWEELKKYGLITEARINDKNVVGYWNPQNFNSSIQLADFDCIVADSFNWIEDLPDPENLITILTENGILNSHGQLIQLDLSQPLKISSQYTPFYKQIKDTLLNHSVYRFAIDHLRKCVIIDKSTEVDYSFRHKTLSTISVNEPQSVIERIVALNPEANASKVSHIEEPLQTQQSQQMMAPISFSVTHDLVPSDEMNNSFRQQLVTQRLYATNVSGDGLNCLINALIQHAKNSYLDESFEDAHKIRDMLLKKHPQMTGMLHPDDAAAKTVLNLINKQCCSKAAKIGSVSVVIASSDGPIVYGGTSDDRHPDGRHVVIWQEGNHYVSIVDQSELTGANVEQQTKTELEIDVDGAVSKVPKLTSTQFDKLQSISSKVIEQRADQYEICVGLEDLQVHLISEKFSELDKGQIEIFFKHKLEIDHETLNAFPTELSADPHLVLFDNLSRYAVIKGIKVKDMSKIKKSCEKFEKEKRQTIISMIQNQRSCLLDLEDPQITLRKLSDVFEDTIQGKSDVLEWFENNQYHFIIDITERKWSLKSILTAVGALLLGVGQIVAGAVLLAVTAGTGTFFANALISEGVSDMIFGVEGLVRGYCSWKDYLKNKLISIAVTVATAGFGALLARGKEVSRYAYKAFGVVSKELAEETAKETSKSVSKVIAKEVGKKIVKKTGEAVVDAGINLAIEAIVDQCSNAIKKFCDGIIDYLDDFSQDKDLREKMLLYLQLHQHNPDEHLHQLVEKVLRPDSFIDKFDKIQDSCEKGLSVATGGYGAASKHVGMAGHKLRGGKFMSAVGKFSKFAPLVSDCIKAGFIKVTMNDMKTKLIDELDTDIKDHSSDHISEEKRKEYKAIIDREFKVIKEHFSQKLHERSKGIVQKGLNLAAQSCKSRAIANTKKKVLEPLRDHIEQCHMKRLEKKANDTTLNADKRKQCKQKMDKMLMRSRSPKVFADMIKNHDAELGPAFAIPALEMEFGRKIKIVTEDGKPLLNVKHHSDGEPNIIVKFIPARDGEPAHYYHGKNKFSTDIHGNNCLIEAVKLGAGKPEVQAKDIRDRIADSCLDKDHPCHGYIQQGIARNYVKIGLTGGKPKIVFAKGELSITSKADWRENKIDLDEYLLADWKNDESNAHYSGIRNLQTASRSLEGQLGSHDLHRCHRLSEKSIHNIISNAIKNQDTRHLKLLKETLLPTYGMVANNESVFTLHDPNGTIRKRSPAADVFLEKYGANGPYKSQYEELGTRVQSLITAIENQKFNNMRYMTSERESLINEAATALSFSPANVSLGHGSSNSGIRAHMDYNPGTPRSENILRKFGTGHGPQHTDPVPGFIGYPKTTNGEAFTSFYSGSGFTTYDKLRKKSKKNEQDVEGPKIAKYTECFHSLYD